MDDFLKKWIYPFLLFFLLLITCGSLLITIATANIYFTEETVLREIQADFPKKKIIKIIKTKRRIYNDATITTRTEGGTKVVYKLNTDILFNYVIGQETPEDEVEE